MDNLNSQTLKTEFVSPDNCIFFSSGNGFLGVKLNDEEYKRIILTRATPLTGPDEYICISDVNKKELGIIENIAVFSEEQRELINAELSMRYYCPVITSIKSIKEKFGNFYFDVLIGEYKSASTIKDLSKNIRYHGEGFDLIDVDGNRYTIRDFSKIEAKSRRKLEPYLY